MKLWAYASPFQTSNLSRYYSLKKKVNCPQRFKVNRIARNLKCSSMTDSLYPFTAAVFEVLWWNKNVHLDPHGISVLRVILYIFCDHLYLSLKTLYMEGFISVASFGANNSNSWRVIVYLTKDCCENEDFKVCNCVITCCPNSGYCQLIRNM